MSDSEGADAGERSSLIVMAHDECVELLEATPIGRVVFVDDGHPIALPVNYRWHDGAVVFRVREGTVLHTALPSLRVSFEVDEWDAQTHRGASVLVKGDAFEVVDWADKEQLEGLQVVPWASAPWRQSWIRVTPTEITGRRIT